MNFKSNPDSSSDNLSAKRRALIFALLLGSTVGSTGLVSDAAGQTSTAPPDASASTSTPSCPPEMVNVKGEFCIDRYEAYLVDMTQGRLTSPYYTPERRKAELTHNYWTSNYAKEGTARGKNTAPPPLEAWQRNEEYTVRAQSKANVIPNGYLNAILAETACMNARKRLCGLWEWRKACMGERTTKYPYGNRYQFGKCNYERFPHPGALLQGKVAEYKLKDPRLNLVDFRGDPYLRPTGEVSACASSWNGDAIYDMVGNLDEWAIDRGRNQYVIVGGAYSRDRIENGCQAKISSHSPDYEDYSLGTRCCKDIEE